MKTQCKQAGLYQIGEFSRICSISIKALRHYQEFGLLEPSLIDEETSYRYYSEKLLERARMISDLRSLEFSLQEISDIFNEMSEDDDLSEVIKKKSQLIDGKIAQLQNVQTQMNIILAMNENMNERTLMDNPSQINIVTVPDQTIATIRFKGRYTDVGIYFKKIFKAAGMQIQGKAATLYFDEGYKEEDADMECYVPVKKKVSNTEVNCRVLKGGKAYCFNHVGPYDSISTSYKKLFDFFNENNISISFPCREIYHKGPGMIFKGNPKKYITEIQLFESEAAGS
jgi:effector-binding domain-containing protein